MYTPTLIRQIVLITFLSLGYIAWAQEAFIPILEASDDSLKQKEISVAELVITAEKNPFSLLSQLDVQLRPIQSSQDVLRSVPGLFIAQHAGGGKAE